MGIIVLGAGGKLGRLLQPIISDDAVWLDRAGLDICDGEALRNALRGAGCVICMAGVTQGCSDRLGMNSDLAIRTLDAAQEVGAGRVLLFSSAAVYGNTPGLLTEDGPTAPLYEYARAKLAMERAAARHAHPNCVLRLGNVAGADAILGGWHPAFKLDALPDGTTPRRSYIGPHALARTLLDLAAAATLPDILNVAAPGCVEMGALLDAAGLAWTPRPATRDTIPTVNLDTTNLQAFTGFKTSEDTPDGIVSDWQNRLA
ncbi:NAD-dependent epimerase/dehydratase family protein [Tateyamaria armeniaca]|uniref:NAD-dependent epimerase/dehydratase family protein n=1 Tax=Tateyamaria armeniaca TaxID=2518930 RepID=A0ABW8UQL9_9RHOB